jgi:hypothetical protein
VQISRLEEAASREHFPFVRVARRAVDVENTFGFV